MEQRDVVAIVASPSWAPIQSRTLGESVPVEHILMLNKVPLHPLSLHRAPAHVFTCAGSSCPSVEELAAVPFDPCAKMIEDATHARFTFYLRGSALPADPQNNSKITVNNGTITVGKNCK